MDTFYAVDGWWTKWITNCWLREYMERKTSRVSTVNYSEPCQLSNKECFAKIVNGFWPLTISEKTLHLRCLTGFFSFTRSRNFLSLISTTSDMAKLLVNFRFDKGFWRKTKIWYGCRIGHFTLFYISNSHVFLLVKHTIFVQVLKTEFKMSPESRFLKFFWLFC